MDDMQPIVAGRHFYWGCCYVCRRTSSQQKVMKRCSGCKAMYYCTPEHQRKHWKRHKRLCSYISVAAETGGVDSFFANQADTSSSDWCRFRMNAVKTCEAVLSRQLAMDEKELFLFPRSCRLCHCVQDEMYDCVLCFCVSYCSQQHRDEHSEQHQQVCQQLQLCLAADNYESEHSVGLPAIPSQIDTRYEGCRPDITCYVPPVKN